MPWKFNLQSYTKNSFSAKMAHIWLKLRLGLSSCSSALQKQFYSNVSTQPCWRLAAISSSKTAMYRGVRSRPLLYTISTWIQPHSWIEPHPLRIHAKSNFSCVFYVVIWGQKSVTKNKTPGLQSRRNGSKLTLFKTSWQMLKVILCCF